MYVNVYVKALKFIFYYDSGIQEHVTHSEMLEILTNDCKTQQSSIQLFLLSPNYFQTSLGLCS